MKVVIPVAGIGSRLRPHTHTQPKALVPVAGKPILSYIVEHMLELGLTDFVFVIGYLGDKIEEFIRDKYPQINTSFVLQDPREGLGHAVWLTKDKVGNDPLLIVLGDTLFDIDLKSVLEQPYSSLGVKKVENPVKFGVAELDAKRFITKVVEKPNIPKSNLALVGIYLIRETTVLMEALDYNIQNDVRSHGEFHLTDGIMRMIDSGIKITTFPVENWYDCGLKSTLLETNAIFLKKQGNQPVSKSVDNSIIIPPVRIAEGAKVTNSIIGPNVSIGEGAVIDYSIIKDSIIGTYAHLQNAVLYQSLIGADSSLKGLNQSLNIGDSAEIDFS